MTRKDVVGALAGAAILALSAWGLRFGNLAFPMRFLWMLDALLGLCILAKTTGNLLAARLPPPPPPVVPEPPSLREDDDEEEIL